MSWQGRRQAPWLDRSIPPDLERRAYHDTVQDGLLDIAAGVYLPLVAGLFYPPPPAGSRVLAIFGLAALLALAHDHLRRRLSYPRTGYVELIPLQPRKLLAGMAVVTLGALAVVLAGLAISGHIGEAAYLYRWVPAWVGAATAGGFFDAARRSGYARH